MDSLTAGGWITEDASSGHRLQWKIRGVLFEGRSAYQTIQVVDTEQFGPALVLDGIMQTTAGDEFIYHEMMAYVALNAHPAPRRVLIIGGGDGGLARDVLKCPEVGALTLVEIDPLVVAACRQYLPDHSASLDDPRLAIVYADGFDFLRAGDAGPFDVILVDSTDPEGGPGQTLYTTDFHRDVYQALSEDGLYIQHTGAPFYNPEVLTQVAADLVNSFPVVRVFWCPIPSYPGSLFSFAVGSRGPDPREPQGRVTWPTRWYTDAIHRTAFSLPPYLAALVPQSVSS